MDIDPEQARLKKMIANLSESVKRHKADSLIRQAQAETDRAEIRLRLNHLISSDEEIRRMTLEIAQLVKQHETRISQLENK